MDPLNTERALAEAGVMRLGIRVMPLLSGNIEIEEVVLEHFRLILERNADGEANWEQIAVSSETLESLPDPEPVAAEEAPAAEPDGSVPSVAIDTLRISDGEVVFRDQTNNTELVLGGLSLQGQQVNLNDKPFDLVFDATVSMAEQPPSAVRFAATALSIGEQGLHIGNWTLQGLGINGSGTVDLSGTQLNTSLALAQVDVLTLLAALNQPAPDGVNEEVLRNISWTATVRGEDDRFTLEPGTLALGQTQIELAGDVELGDVPQFNLSVNSALIDLDYLLPPSEADTNAETPDPADDQATYPTGEAAAATAADHGASAATAPFKATLALKVERLLASGYEITDATLNVMATPQRINVRELSAKMYDGTLVANSIIDQSPRSGGFSADARLQGVDIAQLVAASGQTFKLTGHVNADLQLSAAGADSADWGSRLDGPVKLQLSGLSTPEINAEKIMCQALAVLNQEALTAQFAEGSHFDDVVVSLNFKQGKGTIEQLSAAVPNLKLQGQGAIDLAKGRLDTRFIANITGDLEQLDRACRVTRKMASIDWPITCKGGFHEAPSEWCRITSEDITKIATTLAADKVQDKIEKSIGNKLKGLFGGE